MLENSKIETTVLVDNQGSMDLASHVSVNRRTKHTDERYYYSCQAVADGVMLLQ